MASPSVADALHSIRAKASASLSDLRARKAEALALLAGQHSGPLGHTPSGPRRKGEGVNDEQGILAADSTPTGGARLRITLLAAGFVLGPSGSSVRDVIAATGAEIRSWTESWQEAAAGSSRGIKCRVFVVEGRRRSVLHAISIISAAVERYAELCGGAYSGQAVDRTQTVCGITFVYAPPPRAAVPFAAALRSADTTPAATAAASVVSAAGTAPPAGAMPAARKALGFASPPSNKENALAAPPASALPAMAPGLASAFHHQQGQQLSQAQQGLPSPRRLLAPGLPVLTALPATPVSQHSLGGLGQQQLHRMPSLPALPEGMTLSRGQGMGGMGEAMEVEEAATPAYTTANGTYSLFSSGSLLGAGESGLAGQPHPFSSSSSASHFISAFEATPGPFSSFSAGAGSAFPSAGAGGSGGGLGIGAGRSLFPDSGLGPSASFGQLGTPSLMPGGASLQRQLSLTGADDALLAAAGCGAFQQPSPWAAQQPAVPLMRQGSGGGGILSRQPSGGILSRQPSGNLLVRQPSGGLLGGAGAEGLWQQAMSWQQGAF